MTNTDSTPFKDVTTSLSLRQNDRGAQVGNGWDRFVLLPHPPLEGGSKIRQDFRGGVIPQATPMTPPRSRLRAMREAAFDPPSRGGWGRGTMMPPKVDKARRKPFKRAFAKSLRVNATEPERRLWARLRAGRLGRLHFRRQQVIGPYIVDFFCAFAKLVVELDGSQHGGDEAVSDDDVRTRYLESCGYRVLRFWNGEFLKDPDAVLEAIWRAARPSP